MSEGDANVRYSTTKSDILRQSSMVYYGSSGIAVIRWSTRDLIVKEQNFLSHVTVRMNALYQQDRNRPLRVNHSV